MAIEDRRSADKDPTVDSASSQQTMEDETAEKQESEKQEVPAESPVVEKTELDKEAEEVHKFDFYFLPIPKHLWHDPSKPPRFSLALNAMFGIASTFLVANLYYCQPLLIQLSISFDVTYSEVSRIPTLVQAGYAVGLLLISPLGDLVRRRPLLLLLTFIAATLTIPLSLTKSVAAFEALSFLIGIFTVVPQVLMPLAADLAPPERRASALSIVLSGLLLGVLIARVLAGVVAQFVTWRVVYYLAIGLQYCILLMLYWMLPDYPQRNKNISYGGILWTMIKFLFTEPVLAQACLMSMSSMSTFTNFWVTLTFLLGGPPYFYSTLVIGLFGLIGMFGVCLAPLVGRTIDHLHPYTATLISTVALLFFNALETGAGGISIAAVIITCLGIDVFRQAQQVSLTSNVFGLEVAARARLNAVVLIFLFIGQVMGTSVGTLLFTKFGWRQAAAFSLGQSGFQLLILFVRGPGNHRYQWFGWQGGLASLKMRRSKPAAAVGVEAQKAKDVESGGGAEEDKSEGGEAVGGKEKKDEIREEERGVADDRDGDASRTV